MFFFMCACLLNNYRKKIDVVILVHKNDPTFKTSRENNIMPGLKNLVCIPGVTNLIKLT